MRDWGAYFKKKKITVMGLGLLGRAVGDIEFLASHGAELIVTDLKGAEELKPSLDRLAPFPHIAYTLGEHRKEDFNGRDIILKGPTAPFDSPYIAEAEKNGTPVKMSASWFAELSGIPIIGVTGTRGKSTTTAMLHDIMKASGMRVLLGGNIRGVSTLALLPEVTRESIALMELDSWQCRGFGDEKMSPHVSVFISFMKDHMDYYRGDAALYLEDKAQIFLHQEPSDTLVVGAQALPFITKAHRSKIASTLVVAELQKFPKGWKLAIPGEHNRGNAVCAIEAARALGIDEEIIRSSLENFKGVPGRLELVREVDGVQFYNDTTATTPEATLAALEALGDTQVILIMGGADKMLDMTNLIPEAKKAKRVIFLSGTGTDTIKNEFPDAPLYKNLKDAVADAFASATAGDSILLSPAFASFGMFKNEYDRGDQFIALTNQVPDLSLLKPKVRTLALALKTACEREGFSIIISHGYRTQEEQDALYAKGRTTSGEVVTHAKGGMSYHNYGVAFDIRPVTKEKEDDSTEYEQLLKKAGKLGVELGLEWGGNWKEFVDLPHFQFTAGYTIRDFKEGHSERGFL